MSYRSTEDDNYLRVSSDLIEPPGPYQFLDDHVTPGTRYLYRLEALDRKGGWQIFGPVAAQMEVTAPALDHRLERIRPNPFHPEHSSTTIVFELAGREHARLQFFDASGRLVRVLLDERLEAGRHVVPWDGRNERGEPAPSGVYFFRLHAGTFSRTQAVVKVR